MNLEEVSSVGSSAVENSSRPPRQHYSNGPSSFAATHLLSERLLGVLHPVGYRFERKAGQGRLLVRDEPLASIVQEALEGYASGRLDSQAEVKRFLERFPDYPRDRHGEVRNQRVKELLTRIVYAGYFDYAPWKVTLHDSRGWKRF